MGVGQIRSNPLENGASKARSCPGNIARDLVLERGQGGERLFIADFVQEREFQLALVGALMVAALALILDGLLALAVWVSVPGTGRLRGAGVRTYRQIRRGSRPSPITGRR